MAKKIFDIIPPKESFFKKEEKIEKKEKPIEENSISGNLPDSFFSMKKKKRRGVLKPLSVVLFVLFVIMLLGYSIFSKTKIKIWPKTEILTLKETVIIDPTIEKTDFSSKIIPGTIFTDTRTSSKDFQATGKVKKEERARGIIRVYNAYSTSSQVLVANTRFVSADGKLFRSIKREVIAGGRYEKGKFVPGYTDIEVRAAEPGEEYNIGPTTFSIPGFAGTPKYTAFYGKSFAPMKGGFKGEVSQVTQEDIERAKLETGEELKNESKNFLRKTTPQEYVLLDSLIFQETVKENPSVEPGTEADSFSFEAQIRSEGIAFKKSDIEELAEDIIFSNLPPDKKFQEESLRINYSFKKKEENKATIEVEIRARIYPKFDFNGLKKALSGKLLGEVKIFLSDQPEIEKVEIKSAPFWKKRVHNNLDKIEIDLKLPSLENL